MLVLRLPRLKLWGQVCADPRSHLLPMGCCTWSVSFNPFW